MFKKQFHRKSTECVGNWRFLTNVPFCLPDHILRDICCLPGACICVITKMLPSLIKLEDFLLFHVGTTEAVTRRLGNIKRDFMSLGKMLKGSGVQVVFSILPVREWHLRRRQRMD